MIVRACQAALLAGAAAASFAQEAPRVYRNTTFSYAIVHDFARADPAGIVPEGAIGLGADGAVYGTTRRTGYSYVPSTIYRLDRDGRTSVVHTFEAATGAVPTGGIVRGEDGAFYGTTQRGGEYGEGVIYRVDETGTYTVLHAFRPGSDFIGRDPRNILAPAPGGGVYGTTARGGGKHYGSLYRVASDGTVSVVLHYSREGPSSYGGTPCVAADGSLFQAGRLAVYRIASTGAVAAVARLDPETTGTSPNGLICAADGALYAAMRFGGPAAMPNFGGGGTVVRIDPTIGRVQVLHAFGSEAQFGLDPYRRPTLASDGMLYGTTVHGGNGFGIVWRIATDGSDFRKVHQFAWITSPPRDAQNDSNPDSDPDAGTPLVETPEGELVGSTSAGGLYNDGATFVLTRSGGR